MKFLCHFVRACAVCHNIIIKFEDSSLSINTSFGISPNQTYANDSIADQDEEIEENEDENESAKEKRNRLCALFE